VIVFDRRHGVFIGGKPRCEFWAFRAGGTVKNTIMVDFTAPLSLKIHPNPVSASSGIRFSGNGTGVPDLKIFNLNGVLIKDLGRHIGSGSFSVIWRTRSLAPGTYCCRYGKGGAVLTRKIIICE